MHFVPNGIKLRGHIGSELQRKAAGILSIETDDNPEYSVVKVIKVRDGSPLDVPMMLFGWDKEADMHVYRGEKSKEDKEKRKTDELIAVVKEAFRNKITLSYQELCEVLMREMEIKREFDIKEWHNTLVISVFYFPHSVFQTLILLSDGFLSTSEAQ